MTWLLWRQHRAQALIAFAIVAALAVLLVWTGLEMAATYRAALAACRASSRCDHISLFGDDNALFDTVNTTVAAPLLFGLFWGAPLVAREIENGTHALVWTQSISRTRWLTGKLLTAVLAAAAWGGAISAIVTWWSGTPNSIDGQRFDPVHFGTQGIVPIAYSVFAVCLGIAAGALLRRTLPALAVTVAGFIAMRIVIDNYLRPHYLSPVHSNIPLTSSVPRGAWQLSDTISFRGHALSGAIPVPPHCAAVDTRETMNQCLSSLGYRLSVTYQPAHRYWPFQFIESGLYVAAAALLLIVATLAVRRRDA